MIKSLRRAGGICAVFLAVICVCHPVFAGSGPVIYQLQTSGGSGAASQEFISVYNNSDEPVDVTKWCIVYSSSVAPLGCIAKPDANTTVLLPARTSFTLASSALVGSTAFITAHPGFIPDITFTAGMADSDRYIRLLDANNVQIDRLGWGAAAFADGEGAAVAPHGTGKILQRLASNGQELKDTDNNAADFSAVVLVLPPPSSLSELFIPTDVCPNIDGSQTAMPIGYMSDDFGDCIQDICANINGLQTEIPTAYESLDGENCTLIPLESAQLLITEMLPNAVSFDAGHEFIELYNPNSRPVSLSGYKFQLGPDYTKSYQLPEQLIAPGTYVSLTDTQTELILPNTTASLRLIAPSGDIVDAAASYDQPDENSAWALVDGFWQYTNQLTPGAANLPPLAESSQNEDIVSSLSPCRADQERNPETNRCRLLALTALSLTACGIGQERNPATNRCRSTVPSNDNLVPCKEGQERNPETNRCRNIVSTASALAPCAEGQERNPETNRCRKSTSGAVAGVAQVKDLPATSISGSPRWLLAVLAATGAVGYAAFEWRRELFLLFTKLKNRLTARG